MNFRRPLRSESLESRRLLAAGLNLDQLLAEIPADVSAEPIAHLREAVREEWVAVGDPLPAVAPLVYPGLRYGPDLVQEVGDRLLVVDQDPFGGESGSLLVFQRDAETELELIDEIKVGVFVDQMMVQGDQVVLIGNRFDYRILATDLVNAVDASLLGEDWLGPLPRFPQTAAITVSLGDDVTVVRQELDGLAHTVHPNGDQLVVVSTTNQPSFPGLAESLEGERWTTDVFPLPRIEGRVTTYQITPKGLLETASAKVPLYGMTAVSGNDFFVASSEPQSVDSLYPPAFLADGLDRGRVAAIAERYLPPTVSVSRYLLSEDGIREAESIELGVGYLTDFRVAEDGLTAIATYVDRFAAEASTTIALLDLSGETTRVFDSIRIEGDYWMLNTSGTDYAVLRSWRDQTLVIVDTDQSIDIDSESRLRRVGLPEEVFVDYSVLRLGDDLVLRGRTRAGTDSGTAGSNTSATESESLLIVVSLSEARLVSTSPLPDGMRWGWHEDFFLIDETTQRFGIVAWADSEDTGSGNAEGESLGTNRLQFVFGRLDESGKFQVDGAIPIEDWREIDANGDRLIVRTPDQLLEFDWRDPSNPTVTPLPRPVPPIEAIDDRMRLRDNGTDHTLRVLANDQIHHRSDGISVEIIELLDAPEGAEIVNGRAVRIPAAALENAERIEFGYVISDGEQTSQANVTIKVMPTRISDPRDSTADGEVTAHDVLVVINFLAKYGSTELEALPEKLGMKMPEFDESIPAELDALMRYDTDDNGSITALDALYVINELGRMTFIADADDEDEETVRAVEKPVPLADSEKSDRV